MVASRIRGKYRVRVPYVRWRFYLMCMRTRFAACRLISDTTCSKRCHVPGLIVLSVMAQAQSQDHGSLSTMESSSNRAADAKQHSLSCTHCRQRKIKCDKVHPCSPCSRSGLACVFPERVRHPKKKSGKSKAENDELVRRLSRMDELIERMKVNGKDIHGNKIAEDRISARPCVPGIRREHTQDSDVPRSQRENGQEDGGNESTLFMGGAFLKNLMMRFVWPSTYPNIMKRRTDSDSLIGRRLERDHGGRRGHTGGCARICTAITQRLERSHFGPLWLGPCSIQRSATITSFSTAYVSSRHFLCPKL